MASDQFCNFEGCLGVTDAQARLQTGGLTASPRQATRLLALQQSRVLLSWSALEVLLTEQPSLLMAPGWLQAPAQMLEPLSEVGLELRPVASGFEVLSSDEVWLETRENQLLPAVSQTVSLAMTGTPQAGAGGQEWPDAWKVVADAEDTPRILEHLRAAFRQAQIQGVSTAPLLWLALKRARPEVTREVARLAREHLDADVGRHLEALFSENLSQAQAALRQLSRAEGSGGMDPLFLFGLLRLRWDQPELRMAILDRIEEHTESWLANPGHIADWWEDCLSQAHDLDGALVQRLAQISLHWARRGFELAPMLARRLRRGLSMAERLLAAWLMAQLPLSESASQELLEHILELGCEPNLGGQALVRVQQVLENLGDIALKAVLEPSLFGRLVPELRCWVVGEAMAHPEFREQGEQAALNELAAGSRLMLRQLCGHEWMPAANAPMSDALRWSLVSFLEQEIPHLEPPDNLWAIALLVQLDPAVLERLYKRTEKDAEALSRGYPVRLENWAQHCSAADQAPLVRQLEKFQPLNSFYAERPEVWRSWALFLRCRHLDPDMQRTLLENLATAQQHFPDRWPNWWEEIQQSPVAWLQQRAERDMQNVIASDGAARLTVQAVLDTLARRIESWRELRPLIRTLSQRLLFLAPEPTPQQRLRWALDQKSQGDGIFQPQAWDAEQRDLALALLGKLAMRNDVDEDLRRPLRVRCWQFMKDWLQGVQSGGDSYQHRSMPLWTTARALLPQVGPEELQLVDSIAEQVMLVHSSYPERLRLLTHSDCLGLLLDWSLVGSREERSDHQRQVLQLLQSLLQQADRDYRPVAVGYLVGLDPHRLEPGVQPEWQRLRQRWEGWLYGE